MVSMKGIPYKLMLWGCPFKLGYRLDLIIDLIIFRDLIIAKNGSDRYCIQFPYFMILKIDIYQHLLGDW